MAKIAIVGANGTIGSRVLHEALQRGHQVTAVARDTSKITMRHPNLTVAAGDVLEPDSVATVAEGQDVLISAVGGGPGSASTIEPAAESLVAGLRTLGGNAPRLIAVGGAGSLRTADGKKAWDLEGLPKAALPAMHAHGDALDFYRSVTDGVEWTCLCPAAVTEPGDRTGFYRTALDDLVVADDGTSRISTEDFAVALIDEIEEPKHIGERFAVGY